ncbi:hypothetical protein CHUAL_001292 [Chamberlinius hualienensis]
MVPKPTCAKNTVIVFGVLGIISSFLYVGLGACSFVSVKLLEDNLAHIDAKNEKHRTMNEDEYDDNENDTDLLTPSETMIGMVRMAAIVLIAVGLISFIDGIVAIIGATKEKIVLLGIHMALLLTNIVGCIVSMKSNYSGIFGIIFGFIRIGCVIQLIRYLKMASENTVTPMKPKDPEEPDA